MTRIVGGLARGRRLVVPRQGTRPTSDRAREALFNTLAGLIDLDGARVLDVFAGTGAVGLEALSRGAGHVTLVESDRTAAAALRRNLAAVALPGAVLVQCPVESFLAGDAQAPFRLVYADPPYAFEDDALAGLLGRLAAPGWLEARAIVVVERSARSPGPGWPAVIEPIRQKRYGEGVLWYGRRQ